MTAPIQPTPDPSALSDADLWEHLVAQGTPKDLATRIVKARSGDVASQLPTAGTGGTLAKSTSNGVLFGIGPRLQAAAASIAHSHGHDLSLYHFYLDALQQQQQSEQAAHPVASTTGTIAGAVASPLNKFLPFGGETLPAVVGRGALSAGLAGAAFGAGGAKPGEVAEGAAKGFIGGAAVGAPLAGAGALLARFTPAESAIGRVVNAIKKSGGVQAVQAELQRLANLGKGDVAALADLSPRLRALADEAATASPDAAETIRQVSQGRQPSQAERLLGNAQEALGTKAPSLALRQTALEESRRAWADEAYGALRQANPAVDAPAFRDAIGDLVQQPKIQQVWKEAHDVHLIGPFPDEAATAAKKYAAEAPAARQAQAEYQAKLTTLTDQGVPEAKARAALGPEPAGAGEAPAPSYSMIQSMKQQLDNAAGAAFRSGRTELGARLGQARDVVDQFLADNVPGYSTVNAEYAQRKGLEQALQDGADAWTKHDLGGLALRLNEMTPEELEQFRYGLASQFIEELSRVKTNRDFASRLVNMSKSDQAKLRIVFGDAPTFDRFMQQATAEQQLAQLRGATGNSATARRMASAEAALHGIFRHAATALLYHPTAVPGVAAAAGLRGAAARAAADQASRIAPLLATTGQEGIQGLLGDLVARRAISAGPETPLQALLRTLQRRAVFSPNPATQRLLGAGSGLIGGSERP